MTPWAAPYNYTGSQTIFYCDRQLQNGWKTRIEFRPRGYIDPDHVIKTMIPFPASLLDEDIIIKSAYEDLPYGMIDNKSMTIKLNLEHLQDMIDEIMALIVSKGYDYTALSAGDDLNFDDLWTDYINLKDLQYWLQNPILEVTGTSFYLGTYDPFLFESGESMTVFRYAPHYVYNTWCIYSNRGNTTLHSGGYPDTSYTGDPQTYNNDFYVEGIFCQTNVIGETVNLKSQYEYVDVVLQDSIITAMSACKFSHLYKLLDPYFYLVDQSYKSLEIFQVYTENTVIGASKNIKYYEYEDPLRAGSSIYFRQITLDHFYNRLFEYVYKYWRLMVMRDPFSTTMYNGVSAYTGTMFDIFKEHPLYKHIFYKQKNDELTSSKGDPVNWTKIGSNYTRVTDKDGIYVVSDGHTYTDKSYPHFGLFGLHDNLGRDSLVSIYKDSIYKFLVDNTEGSGYVYQLKYERDGDGNIFWKFTPNKIIDTTESITLNKDRVNFEDIQKKYMVLNNVKVTINSFNCTQAIKSQIEQGTDSLLEESLNIKYNFSTSPDANVHQKYADIKQDESWWPWLVGNSDEAYAAYINSNMSPYKLVYPYATRYTQKVFDDVDLEAVYFNGTNWVADTEVTNNYAVYDEQSYGAIATGDINFRLEKQATQSGYGKNLARLYMKKFSRPDQIAMNIELLLDDAVRQANKIYTILPNDCGITGVLDLSTTKLATRYNIALENFRVLESELSFKDCKVKVKLFFHGTEDPLIKTV
jgi:hypothetical protein